MPDDVIEHGVEVVEEVNDLEGRAVRWDDGEADDVWEVDAHFVEALGLHAAAADQSFGHAPEHQQ